MIRLRKDMHRHPHGGHHYPQDGHTFAADSVNELTEMIEEYRLENGKPLGNPLRDVTLYYAKVAPWMVEDADEIDMADEQCYQDRAIVWLRNLYLAGAPKLVASEQAAARIGICMACEHNKPWGSGPEDDDAKRREFLVLLGKVQNKAGVCDKLDRPCNLFAWLKENGCDKWPK